MVKTEILFCFMDRVQLDQSNKQTIIHPKVINLSSTCLTDTQVRVFSKDLKCTPAPRRNTIQMEKDIHNFKCKLILTQYFANENDITSDEQTQPLVKNKGTFHPLEIETKRLILLLTI